MKTSYKLDEAVELFQKRGMTDKVKLFRYRRGSFVNVYEIDGYLDYYQFGTIVNETAMDI